MADWFNPTTLAFRPSVGDLPSPWVRNPDMSAVATGTGHGTVFTVPPEYWKLAGSGDRPEEMTVAEKAAVDSAKVEADRDAIATQIDNLEDIVRAALLVIMDELNDQHTTTTNAILAAAENATSLGDFQTRMNAISDIPTRTAAQFRTAVRNRLGS